MIVDGFGNLSVNLCLIRILIGNVEIGIQRMSTIEAQLNIFIPKVP
jgi:hypothetical protein